MRGITLIELFKHVLHRFFINRRTAVGDGEMKLRSRLRKRDIDGASMRTEFNSVIHEVGEDMIHQGFNGSKIHPPKYENGKKLGVFATRTPHRINSIGLTLCKFDRIENNEIFISCIDMVSGTPIIDIKPYHHLESVDVFAPGMKYPDWIKNADKGIKAKVTILPEAEKNLDDILSTKKLIFYSKKEELLPLIKGVLEIDPHSKYTKKKQGTLLYAFHLDKLNVIYEYNAQKGEIVVHEIEYSEEYKKLRNKEWTENYKHHTTKDEK